MQIVYKNVDELIPYVNNPRINDHAVDAVASSIKNFGFRVPIIIDARNEIVAGHTRLKAAKKLGMKEIPTLVADDLDDNQIRAFRLADNKVGELAEWDFTVLEIELQNIDDIDMSNFEFDDFSSDDDLDDLDTSEQDLNDVTVIVIDVAEHELEQTFDKLTESGYSCRILTL